MGTYLNILNSNYCIPIRTTARMRHDALPTDNRVAKHTSIEKAQRSSVLLHRLWCLQLLRFPRMAATRVPGLSSAKISACHCKPSSQSAEDACKLRTQSFAHQKQQFTSLKIFRGQSLILRPRRKLTLLVSMWNLNTVLFYCNIEISNLK